MKTPDRRHKPRPGSLPEQHGTALHRPAQGSEGAGKGGKLAEHKATAGAAPHGEPKRQQAAGEQEPAPTAQRLERAEQAAPGAAGTEHQGQHVTRTLRWEQQPGHAGRIRTLPNNQPLFLCISDEIPLASTEAQGSGPTALPCSLTYQHFQVIATKIQLF